MKIFQLLSILLFLFFGSKSVISQVTVIESHIMGHSLLDHASSTQETKTAYWIDQFADEAGLTILEIG
jgi:hypothetical protein